jgi:hypothetical protein
MGPLGRLISGGHAQITRTGTTNQPLPYSWILTNKLAVGPMPRIEGHWRQLQEVGFRSRFSCCYPHEEIFAPVPEDWISEKIALPDHRDQEVLQANVLEEALIRCESLIETSAPLYLHCFAGRERSSLVAVGLTARQKDLDVFTALDWVRRCHPAASPIYDHLAILEGVLKEMNCN